MTYVGYSLELSPFGADNCQSLNLFVRLRINSQCYIQPFTFCKFSLIFQQLKWLLCIQSISYIIELTCTPQYSFTCYMYCETWQLASVCQLTKIVLTFCYIHHYKLGMFSLSAIISCCSAMLDCIYQQASWLHHYLQFSVG